MSLGNSRGHFFFKLLEELLKNSEGVSISTYTAMSGETPVEILDEFSQRSLD